MVYDGSAFRHGADCDCDLAVPEDVLKAVAKTLCGRVTRHLHAALIFIPCRVKSTLKQSIPNRSLEIIGAEHRCDNYEVTSVVNALVDKDIHVLPHRLGGLTSIPCPAWS